MPGGQCEGSWALLQCCSPGWWLDLAPAGQHLAGGVAVVVGAGLDAVPESLF